MRKTNFFKIGATAYILLGIMHIASQLSTGELSENVVATLAIMKNTSVEMMGQHNLMQFYTGFSIMMGFMLIAFGLQAFVIKHPTKTMSIINTSVSLIASLLAIIFFHPLAYSFLLLATLCFGISLITFKKQA